MYGFNNYIYLYIFWNDVGTFKYFITHITLAFPIRSQSRGRFRESVVAFRSTNAFANAPLCVDFCDEQIYDSFNSELQLGPGTRQPSLTAGEIPQRSLHAIRVDGFYSAGSSSAPAYSTAVIIVNMSNDLDADATNDEELERWWCSICAHWPSETGFSNWSWSRNWNYISTPA